MTPGPVVVITGAGATHLLGANNKNVPMMGEWAADIVERLDRSGFGLADTLGLHRNMAGEEFELHLGRFLAWERGISTTAELSDLGEDNPSMGVPRVFEQWLQKARANAQLINTAIFQSLFACFGSDAISTFAAKQSYEMLLELLQMERSVNPLTIATTNYDFAAEEALSALGWRPYWGEDAPTSTTGGSPSIHLENLTNATALNHTPILHLHGRVGWYRKEDGQLVSIEPSSQYNEAFGTPGLLLPDPDKNYEQDKHFRVVWDELRKALQEAKRVLVLGHSLNDAGLRRELAPYLGSKVRVTICPAPRATHQHIQIERNRVAALLPGLPPNDIIPMTFGPDVRPDGPVRAAFETWS